MSKDLEKEDVKEILSKLELIYEAINRLAFEISSLNQQKKSKFNNQERNFIGS